MRSARKARQAADVKAGGFLSRLIGVECVRNENSYAATN